MALRVLSAVLLLSSCVCAAPANEVIVPEKTVVAAQDINPENDDLKTDASGSYAKRYTDYGYSGGYGGVTGYGLLDDRYNTYNGADYNGYDNSIGYNNYGGYNGYSGVGGYNGYNRGYSGYGSSGYGTSGYGGYGGYGGNGGLNSYYGYNNPYYQSANHLGYGYYNRRNYGNIYSNGVTPNVITGYRGYSRR